LNGKPKTGHQEQENQLQEIKNRKSRTRNQKQEVKKGKSIEEDKEKKRKRERIFSLLFSCSPISVSLFIPSSFLHSFSH